MNLNSLVRMEYKVNLTCTLNIVNVPGLVHVFVSHNEVLITCIVTFSI